MDKFSRDDVKEIKDADLPAYLVAAQINLDTSREKRNNSTEFWQGVEQRVQIRQEMTIRTRRARKNKQSDADLAEDIPE